MINQQLMHHVEVELSRLFEGENQKLATPVLLKPGFVIADQVWHAAIILLALRLKFGVVLKAELDLVGRIAELFNLLHELLVKLGVEIFCAIRATALDLLGCLHLAELLTDLLLKNWYVQ